MGGSGFDRLSRTDVLTVVGVNAVPVVGVVSLGWSLSELLVLYWVEVGIAIAFSVLYVLLYDLEDIEDVVRNLYFEDYATVEMVVRTGVLGVLWLLAGWLLSTLLRLAGYSQSEPVLSPGTLRVVAPALLASAAIYAAQFCLNFVRTGPGQRSRATERWAVLGYRVSTFSGLVGVTSFLILQGFDDSGLVVVAIGLKMVDEFYRKLTHSTGF